MMKIAINWSDITVSPWAIYFPIHRADKLNTSSKLNHKIGVVLSLSLKSPLDRVIKGWSIYRIRDKKAGDARSMNNGVEIRVILLGMSLRSLSHSGVVNNILHILENFGQVLRILRH